MKVITKTSSLSSTTLEGLLDELSKIASAESQREERRKSLKKFLKATAITAGGAGLGYGAGMLAERGSQKLVGPRWDRLKSSQKLKYLGAGLGLTTAGLWAAREWNAHERKEALK